MIRDRDDNQKAKLKTTLAIVQLILSSLAYSYFIWYTGDYLKGFIGYPYLYAWTNIYFHPLDSHLVNYLLFGLFCFIVGLLLYIFLNVRNKQAIKEQISVTSVVNYLMLVIISSFIIIFISCFSKFTMMRYALSFVISMVPILWFFDPSFKVFQIVINHSKLLSSLLLFLALLILVIEHLGVINGEVYLMNEYAKIYTETMLDNKVISNRVVFKNLKILDDSGEQIKRDDPALQTINRFYLANRLESIHQNMGRGQINHIGHILNPLNEFNFGKHLQTIYFQYGLGNTFVMKWIMEYFGGLSIHNYYKTYYLYILYMSLFLGMVIYLFRDTIYISGSFLSLLICFFLTGYTAYIVAPGIIPSIHLMDAPAMILLGAFFRHKNILYLILALLSAIIGIILNTYFGIFLSIAIFISIGCFIFETKPKHSILIWIAGIFVITFISTIVVRYPKPSTNVFHYQLAGLFSWPGSNYLIILTILYFLMSYGFCFVIKQNTSALKYVFISVFCYCQLILIYYYWSGLINHLFPVLPFFAVQLFLMLKISRQIMLPRWIIWAKRIDQITIILLLLLIISIPPSAYGYYKEKISFFKNFKEHTTYIWTFNKANLRTTIPTSIIRESVSLIQNHSDSKKPEIFILSKYDSFLPFVANRYSAMPFFDLTSYLFSSKEYNLTINSIKSKKPDYIFVDTDIRESESTDLSSLLVKYFNEWGQSETESRIGRYKILEELFEEVRNEYQIIAQGELITVYKRKENIK